jgi:hypothetical protein
MHPELSFFFIFLFFATLGQLDLSFGAVFDIDFDYKIRRGV